MRSEGGLLYGQFHSVSFEEPQHFYVEEGGQQCFDEKNNHNCPLYSFTKQGLLAIMIFSFLPRVHLFPSSEPELAT